MTDLPGYAGHQSYNRQSTSMTSSAEDIIVHHAITSHYHMYLETRVASWVCGDSPLTSWQLLFLTYILYPSLIPRL